MSRVFDALRKSQKSAGTPPYLSPDAFLDTLEKTRDLKEVPIERVDIFPESRIVVSTDPHSLGAERFRRLRTRLRELRAGRKLKTLLVTSPLPQDGKSTVALNLATALADQEDSPVLVLEGDLRRPFLKRQLGLKAWPGLSECLQQGVEPLAALRRMEPLGFYLLPAGQSVAKPTELLQSQRFSSLIESLTAYFNWILIDSPPVVPVADTLVLKAHTDATLLVGRAGVTPREAIEEALKNLGPDHVIGLILNGADGLTRSYYRHYRPDGRDGSPSVKTQGK